MENDILEVRNLTKSYTQGGETIHVLDQCNFSAKQGEIIGIIGQSGSGKSTLLHILGLLDNFEKGEIIFNKTPISKFSDHEKSLTRLNKIGFIYQFHHLLPEFTVAENIVMPLIIAEKNPKYIENKLHDISKKLGIFHKLSSFPSEISGGEQQRVAIARALVNHPMMVLADEPTGNLDPHNSELVMRLFMENVKELNLTAIIVTHNFQLIDKFDRLYKLNNGKIELFDQNE